VQRLVRSSILLQIKLNKIEFHRAGISSTFLFFLFCVKQHWRRARIAPTNQPMQPPALFLSAPLCIQLALLKWRGAKVSLYLKGEDAATAAGSGEYLFFNFITLKLIEYLLPLLYLPSLPDATSLPSANSVARLFYFCASSPRLARAKLS